MTGAVILSVGSATHPGRRREVNEDSFLARAPVFLVADGMGGYEAGDRASRAVVEAFDETVADGDRTTIEAVRDALTGADEAVASIAADTTRGAGSTVTGIALVDSDGTPSWLVFNVGDSRVYRHFGTELQQLTVDHSLAQELVDDGSLAPEDMRSYAQRNVITRAIGAPDSTADSWLLPVTNGERLLLCSDGLTSEVSDEAIRATLTMSGRPESAAEALVARANEAGGRDNITVVVVDVVAGGLTQAFAGEPTSTSAPAESTLDATTIPVREVRG
ncbi:PP2C family protein-serine/threonine phosphatase [Agromyces larvae]|uniref:Protein phosphatase 2C domain-containing protein n=1 Tax=Agromyces larvae TaxID=2929802 RepID=A0ABY4C1W8_9MICO|nr:protein phosphatase 2C domain-containing protein [Agromyces larvae]UOE43963.1 protein phosphatase 2C domain-containing protein [Agromyces larvae]